MTRFMAEDVEHKGIFIDTKINEKVKELDELEGKLLKCNHCDYQWQYKGKSKHYATCPRCLCKCKVEQ